MVEEAGFEPAYAKRADLQSVSFNHSDTPPSRQSRCIDVRRRARRLCESEYGKSTVT